MAIVMSYRGFLSSKCPKAHVGGKMLTPVQILDYIFSFDREISLQSQIPKTKISVTAKEWGDALKCFPLHFHSSEVESHHEELETGFLGQWVTF